MAAGILDIGLQVAFFNTKFIYLFAFPNHRKTLVRFLVAFISIFLLYFSGAGKDVGMNVLLSPDPDEYISSTRSYAGIQVSVHGQETYSDSNHLIVAQSGFENQIYVTPCVVSSDDEVKFRSQSVAFLI